jgi:3-oxoadipate enol-lactonase
LSSELQQATKPENFAVARDGTRIAYSLRERSDPGRRVVLVHSLAMDRSFWQPVAERLKAAVLTYDCRGHGASGKPAGPYSIDVFANDLADLLDHVGWPRAMVAGASMGGCVALGFAGAYPARTRALGLVDTTAWYGAKAKEEWADRADKAVQSGLSILVNFQTTRWFGDAFRAQHPDVVKRSVDVFLANDVKAYAETCKMLGNFDLRPTLPKVQIPTAVIVGEEDYATPVAMANVLHHGIFKSTMTVLRGARHLTPLAQPDAIAAEFERLLQAQPLP